MQVLAAAAVGKQEPTAVGKQDAAATDGEGASGSTVPGSAASDPGEDVYKRQALYDANTLADDLAALYQAHQEGSHA